MTPILLALILLVVADIALTLRHNQTSRIVHRWWPGDWCFFIRVAVRKRNW